MPAEPTKDAREETAVAVPGVLCVGPARAGRSVVHLGPAAGWMVPAGIFRWERELSFVRRADMTAPLAKALHATLPHEQIAAKRFGRTIRAVEASPLLALSSNLVEGARKEGVRVHTVGVDRVSSDFYYFAEGGSGESLRVQGNLIEMLGDRVSDETTNADIEALEVSLINRLLSELSKGHVSELEVELADALPRLSRDGTGLAGTDLEAFEAQASALAKGSARFEAAGRRLAEALASATRRGQAHASVPLYGEAQRETMAALEVQVMGKPLVLPECFVWTVSGAPREERGETAARPVLRAVAGRTSATSSESAAEAAPAPAPPPAPALAPASAAAPAPEPAPAPTAAPASATAATPASATGTASGSASPTASAQATALAPGKSSAHAAASKRASAPTTSSAAASKAKIAPAAKPGPSAVGRSAFMPIVLLLGMVASLYFLWRSLWRSQ